MKKVTGAWKPSVLLFLGLLALYLASGRPVGTNDAYANAALAVQLLEHRKLTFTPDESPHLFVWPTPSKSSDGRPVPKYFLSPSASGEGFVNTFGLGAAITALPFLGVLSLFVGKLSNHEYWMWMGSKAVAAACVAGSAVGVFLIALGFLSRRRAVFLAFAYGVGTCVYSVSSQSLFQHGPSTLFLALGTYFFLRAERSPRSAAASGFALAFAALCRPTSALALGAAGLFLLGWRRRSTLPFTAGALLPLSLLLAFNAIHNGGPFAFGQTERSVQVALLKTGAADLWQTPFLTGATGLLFSPSRGMFVYSPFLLAALWGFARVWRQPAFTLLRPLSLAVVSMMAVAFKWFDWWGGWSFGYRPLVDTVVLLTVLMIPVFDTLLEAPALRRAFAGLVVLSCAVQLLGAFAYDSESWNRRAGFVVQAPNGDIQEVLYDVDAAKLRAREGKVVRRAFLDIDRPEFRWRLWSLQDSQLAFSLSSLHLFGSSKAEDLNAPR